RTHADLRVQGNAAWRGLRGPAHDALVAAQRFGQLDRHGAAERGIGLGPVEADAEVGATGAAGQAGVTHGAAGRAVDERAILRLRRPRARGWRDRRQWAP